MKELKNLRKSLHDHSWPCRTRFQFFGKFLPFNINVAPNKLGVIAALACYKYFTQPGTVLCTSHGEIVRAVFHLQIVRIL